MVKPVTSWKQISKIVVKGYKSIESVELRMGSLNVLIGANGAGKSNFIGFFRMIQNILNRNLQNYVGQAGGPDAMLHYGRKLTRSVDGELYFGNNGYLFNLQPTADNRLMFSREALWWNMKGDWHPGSGHFETKFADRGAHGLIWEHVVPAMRSWRVYHFHDTSSTALVKQLHNVGDNLFLRDDASNLAGFLLLLWTTYPEHYGRIIKTIRLVAPFFGDFLLRPSPFNTEKIQLEWTELGKDVPFTASALSDGTLRFMCLATVLLQPQELMPAAILIDEPELGLHPFAVTILGGLMKSAAIENQLIISTQSVELVNEFDLEDLIVVDKRAGASTFARPDPQKLSEWMEEYSLGDLWKKNILGGRPGL
ncbi:AAA family ATPase [Novosphingobium resinovorum]|uniref:Chromosome segregation protein SMC n=1 Tax=Novosphingobium resinovorum TaxID=158500 RepID=A0A1D8A2Y9_9SPHN|nr:AAA family ATPase [Novosphingobium resinovorum]AOR76442.1 chromosome segregation protein SMC [Novosphingobium resinovorum]